MNTRRIDIYRTHRRRRSQARAARPGRAFHLEETQKVRAGIVLVFFILLFAVLLYRAFDLTILKHDRLVAMADRMHDISIELTQPRGEIIDRNGVPLAVRTMAESVFADPKKLEDVDQAVKLLSSALSLDPEMLHQKLADKTRRFVWLKRKISVQESAALPAKLPPGLGRVNESARQYPYGRMAAALIGFADIDTVGLEGLELQYDDVLAGQAGKMIGQRDAHRRIFFPDGVQVRGFQPGGMLRLTLDAHIQWYAENALDATMAEFKPKGAWAIVMDVQTGEILAIANRPTYDPSNPSKYPPENRQNRALINRYEPGSTMKPVTMAMGLEEGKVDLNEKIYCESGTWHLYGSVIQDAHGHGWLTPSQIIQVSSNIGSAKIAMRLGREKVWGWLSNFGFSHPSGIDLPGEASGQMLHWSRWYPIAVATHAYGHGFSVTALQMLCAISCLGNHGNLMRPYVVAETLDASGRVITRNYPQIRGRIVSEKTAQTVVDMMKLVTQQGGTARRAALDGFEIAGKTGTAYKVNGLTRRYDKSRLVSSFVGLAPGYDPQLGIIVVVDEPSGHAYGGTCAAPAFREIAENALRYRGIYGRQGAETQPTPPRPPVLVKRGPAPSATPAPEMRAAAEGQTPNFLGLTMRRAVRLAIEQGIEIRTVGSGVAVGQNPPPHESLPANKVVTVQFGPSS